MDLFVVIQQLVISDHSVYHHSSPRLSALPVLGALLSVRVALRKPSEGSPTSLNPLGYDTFGTFFLPLLF